MGSAACAQCHRGESEAWKPSQHAAAMQVARSGTVLARFDSTRFSDRGVTSTFFQRGGRYFANTEGADGKSHDFEITYTFGVFPLQQYLVRFADGRMQPLPGRVGYAASLRRRPALVFSDARAPRGAH